MSIDVRHEEAEEKFRAERTGTAEVIPVPDPAAHAYGGSDTEEHAAAGSPFPIQPFPFPPFLVRRSGIYRLDRPIVLPPTPVPIPIPHHPIPPIPPLHPGGSGAQAQQETAGNGAEAQVENGHNGAASPLVPMPPITPLFGTEELRVDVDGVKPTMTVSGTITRLFGGRLTWIARVTKDSTGAWVGPISYRDGTTSLRPQANVSVRLTGGPFLPLNRKAIATFSGGTGSTVTLNYNFSKAAFREVAFEYDTVSDATAVTAHNPASHPVHAPGAPSSTLSLESAYARLGIQVTKTGGDSSIGVPPGTAWSDMEMHDAMQAHWSRWADAPQWAVWVLFARLHDMGTGLGGIMFDDIGTAQRQGTSIFSDSFISQPPAGEGNPGPWVERMKFWTAMHEIGHAFNLAHSWQKSLGTPWVPLANEPEARSFMNYPYYVAGGQASFFSTFQYRFSNPELLFIRHAPERFVQMGNAAWFDHHGFTEAAVLEEPTLKLELRVNRERARYEFMEPVWLELKLTNVGDQPRLVDADVLDADSLTVILKKEGKDARQLVPFRQKCVQPATKALMAGDSIYGTVLASAGLNGWDVAEPGTYLIQAAAHVGDENVVSDPFVLRIAPPISRDEEYVAGDVFTQETARVLVFGGSRFLEDSNDVLQEVVERFPERRIALHARVALGNPLTLDYKLVKPTDGGLELDVVPANPGEAVKLIEPALVGQAEVAAESFWHIRYRGIAERVAGRLAAAGAEAEAMTTIDSVIDTLAARTVNGRPVKAEVIEQLTNTRETLAAGRNAKTTGRKAKTKA